MKSEALKSEVWAHYSVFFKMYLCFLSFKKALKCLKLNLQNPWWIKFTNDYWHLDMFYTFTFFYDIFELIKFFV